MMTCLVTLLAVMMIAVAPVTASAAVDPPRLTLWQVFITNSATADNTFSYMLRPLNPDNPMPAGGTAEGYTLTATGDTYAHINLPGYSRQGVYRYELFQVIGTAKPDYTYDRRVYTIEVHVNETSDISAIIVFNRDGTKTENIEFVNVFNHTPAPVPPPGAEPPVSPPQKTDPDPSPVNPSPVQPPVEPPIVQPPVEPLIDLDDDGVARYWFDPSDPLQMVDPPVKKTVSGDPDHDSTFTFKLEAADPLQPMPSGSENGVKTITITGSGEGEFGTWIYEREGAYYYTISEVNTGEAGYVFDTTVYTITDMVRGENQQLVVSRTVTNAMNKPVSTFIFINKYGSDGPKTGDDTDTLLFIALISLGGVMSICAAAYLISGGKRRQ
jgi:pilin isopeptide linkage protein